MQLAEPDGEIDATPDPDAVPQPELPSPAATIVFTIGLETTVESIMRLSTTGPASIEIDIDDAGLVGGIGSQRRPTPNEMSMSAPLPPHDLQHRRGCIIPHTWTMVNEPTKPYKMRFITVECHLPCRIWILDKLFGAVCFVNTNGTQWRDLRCAMTTLFVHIAAFISQNLIVHPGIQSQ